MRLSLHRSEARTRSRSLAAVCFALCAALTASACSSSSSPAAGPSGSASLVDTASAHSKLLPYLGHPSAFPEDNALGQHPAAGSKFVYLQCSTPICALIGTLLAGPTKALGVSLTIVNSGSSATSSQAAAATAMADKPAAVLLPAVDPQIFGASIKQMTAAGIAVTGVGIIDGEAYGVPVSEGGEASIALAGQLLADWVVSQKGGASNTVFFGTPELNFTPTMQAGFKSEMAQVCGSCATAYQSIPIATFGNTAPSAVVSYLQAHQKVNTVVFASMEAATGLAAALKDAGIHVTTVGFAPTPSNLQDIKNGGLTAGLGLDLLVQEWNQVNLAARQLAHESITPAELDPDLEFLTQGDVTAADTSQGWTGYPDVAQRFEKLWTPAG
ncbi:MAG TPA: substrate-binding domain-containing protein [Actinocrinis sp.]|nr:substrate-binding domain-containing protein [Actinocrinis sp.]